MDLESTSGGMETHTKENGRHVLGMDKAAINFKTEISMLENIHGAKLKDWANTLGEIKIFTQVNSSTGKSMDKAIGRRAVELTQTSTKVTTTRTRSMVMESSFGAQEVNTKATTTMIKRRDMEKCIGLTEVFTEGFGLKEFSQE